MSERSGRTLRRVDEPATLRAAPCMAQSDCHGAGGPALGRGPVWTRSGVTARRVFDPPHVLLRMAHVPLARRVAQDHRAVGELADIGECELQGRGVDVFEQAL